MVRKHSRVGIASFSTSIFTGISIFILIVIAGVIGTTNPELAADSTQVAVIGLFFLLLMLLDLVAFGLGIAGLFQKDRQKIFAILGTIFSTVIVIGVISLIVIGNSIA